MQKGRKLLFFVRVCSFPLFVTLKARKEKTTSPALCPVRTNTGTCPATRVLCCVPPTTCGGGRFAEQGAGTGAASVLPLETPACTPSPAAHPGAVAPASLSSQVTPTSLGGATSSRGQFCCPSSSETCPVVSWFTHPEPRDTPNWTVVASPIPGFTRMFRVVRHHPSRDSSWPGSVGVGVPSGPVQDRRGGVPLPRGCHALAGLWGRGGEDSSLQTWSAAGPFLKQSQQNKTTGVVPNPAPLL